MLANFQSFSFAFFDYYKDRTRAFSFGIFGWNFKLEFSRFFKDKQVIFIPANDNLKKTSFKKLLKEYIKYIRTSSSILIGL